MFLPIMQVCYISFHKNVYLKCFCLRSRFSSLDKCQMKTCFEHINISHRAILTFCIITQLFKNVCKVMLEFMVLNLH